MTDTETTTEAAQPAEHDGTEGERLTRVENAVERIEQAISRIVPGSHAEAERRTERRLDRGSELSEAVQAELAKRDRQAAEQQAADAERTEKESVAERLARLEEKPPAPARSRWTAALGWGDGRS